MNRYDFTKSAALLTAAINVSALGKDEQEATVNKSGYINNKKYDICVVGGGIIGLCTAYYAAKAKKNVLLIERNTLGTQDSSSAGHVRMWRTVYDDLEHATLSFSAGKLYHELEEELNSKFIYMNGLLNFGIATGDTPQGTLFGPIKVLKKLNKQYEILTKKELETKYPFKNLPEDYMGLYSPDNATIDVKHIIRKLGQYLKESDNVTVLEYTEVNKISSRHDGVTIMTANDNYKADKIVITSNAFTNKLLPQSLGIKINYMIWDMCFSYYKLTGEIPERNYPMFFQFENPKNGYSNLFYGFPSYEFARKGFIRLAVDWASHKFYDVDDRIFAPKELDINITRDFVINYMRGVDTTPIDMARALHADLPDNTAVLDFIPKQYDQYQNIVLSLGGWTFKFAPLFGKACADLALTGKAGFDNHTFRINRKNIIQPI
ncbi:FAD-dependent oxidoreductase [Xenorhabdus sp. SGI246]|uniref:FAD-dependent oxidoreductase n=1 Tax=Xenorhabdus sp. SGI246 TaxID=3158263 RepID=UPI00349F1481